MIFKNAIGERVILKRATTESIENEFLKIERREDVADVVSVGEDCSEFLQSIVGKTVMFAPNAFESLGIEDSFEYLLIHKSALLAY